jgi:hypothetical protein
MDIETVRRLTLAGHLYELGLASSRSGNYIHLFSAAKLFQDAVESFLVAVADHVGAVLDQNTNFDQYFVKIDAKIAPNVLPFKNKLIRLNKVRVSSKHYGIQPERNECSRLALTVREFFDEVSNSVLGASFSTVSAIDLLRNGETKVVLLEAKNALEAGEFEDFDPTDFIVYDHSSVNEKLLTEGADNIAYWNVWRLTPEVYKTKEGNWVIKHEFSNSTLSDSFTQHLRPSGV